MPLTITNELATQFDADLGRRQHAEPVMELPGNDGAILRIKQADASGSCQPLSFVSASLLKVGELATALGFGASNIMLARPLKFAGATTVAELKAQLRTLPEEIKNMDDQMPLLVFEGRSREGDSGGPIIDENGGVLGNVMGQLQTSDEVGNPEYFTFASPAALPEKMQIELQARR